MTDIHPLFDAPFAFLYSITYTGFIGILVFVCMFFVVFGVLLKWAFFGDLETLRSYLTSRETYKKRFLETYCLLKDKKQELDQIDRQEFYTHMTYLWRGILYAKTDKKIVFSLTYTEMVKRFPKEYEDILEQFRETYFGEFYSKKEDSFFLRAKMFDAVEKWENVFDEE